MIARMEKVFICALSADNAALMAELMRLSCLEITDPGLLPELDEVTAQTTRGTADLYAAEQGLSRLKSCMAEIAPYAKKRAMFERKPVVAYQELSSDGTQAAALCTEIEQHRSDLSALAAEKAKAAFAIEALTPWKGLDIPLSELKTKTTAVALYTVPLEVFDSVSAQLAEEKLSPYIEETAADDRQKYLAVLCHRSEADAVYDVMRRSGAAKAPFDCEAGTVSEAIDAQQKRVAELEASTEYTKGLLKDKGAAMPELQLAYDSAQIALDRGRAMQNLLHTGKTFLCTAWVPADSKPTLEALLQKYTCYYEYRAPDEGEEAPVLLKNSPLVEPFEAVTEMYSVPSYNGIDPNAFMAPFFFVFFGMMLSDAGYGLLMVIGGLIALKKMDLGATAKKFMKLVTMCGVSTVIFGLAYGTLFGDLIPSVASTFFGKTVTMPMIIDPLSNPILMLGVCMALGVAHLFYGMGISAYMKIKRGKPWDALFDVGFWYLFLIGLILWIGGGFLAPTLATAGKYVTIAGALGLVCTQGREKPTFFGKLFGGLKALYDVTGYFSDILSYSRILALGLATGVIGTVINLMGGMINIPVVKVIAFILIFLVGHGINFGINALGAYVHTARLQYVEFFGKFFEGGGTKFVPFKPNTKYVTVNLQEE